MSIGQSGVFGFPVLGLLLNRQDMSGCLLWIGAPVTALDIVVGTESDVAASCVETYAAS